MLNYLIVFFISITSIIVSAKTSMQEYLPIDSAQKILDKAFDCGKKNKWQLSVAIVNSEGNLILFKRDDNSYVGSIDAAIAKAKSANAFRRPTKAFADSLNEGRTGLLSVNGIVAVEGGQPILGKDEKHIGAIGISGARAAEDQVCALEAVK